MHETPGVSLVNNSFLHRFVSKIVLLDKSNCNWQFHELSILKYPLYLKLGISSLLLLDFFGIFLIMAQYNKGNGTGKPTQKQNYPGTASNDSADKETIYHDLDGLQASLELVHELTMKEVINTILRDMMILNIVMR